MEESIKRTTDYSKCIDMFKERNIWVDIFRPQTIAKMVEPRDYTMRVFVRSCQNLAAVDNRVINIRNKLAGDVALSSADPFLFMSIMGEKQRMVYDGRPDAKEETLDPQFYQDHEIAPISLQEDWRFEIEVKDKGNLGAYSDSSIGITMIDLEQRRWSTEYALSKLALEQEIDISNERIEENEKILKQNRGGKHKDDNREKYVSYLKSHKRLITDIIKQMSKKELPQSDVEMRSLKNPERLQA